MHLSKQDVEHLAKLSRLQLSDEQAERMAKENEAILGYVDRLQQVDVTDVEPFAMLARSVGWRADQAMPVDEAVRELLLSNFPDRHGDLLAAPGVFELPKR